MSASALPPPLRRSRGHRVLDVLLLLSCAAGIIALNRRDPGPRQAAIKNLAIAALENFDLRGAESLLGELGEDLPEEPFVARNLAVARVLVLKDAVSEGPAAVERAGARAEEALQTLARVEPESPATWILTAYAAAEIARSASSVGDDEREVEKQSQAVEYLKKAAQFAPKEAGIWYALYLLAEEAHDDAIRREASRALEQAHQLAPDNLFVLLRMLKTKAEASDPQCIELFGKLKDLITGMPGLADNIKLRVRIDPVARMEEGVVAAQGGDWAGARQRASQLENVIKGETWSQSDLRRVDKHPLEFLRYDMRTASDAEASEEAEPAEIQVGLRDFEQQPPSFAGVEDFALADFDLNGGLDLIILSGAGVEVLSSNDQRDPWRRIASCPLPGRFEKLVVADLDWDAPKRGSEAATDNGQPAKAAGGKPLDICDKPGADVDLVVYGPDGAVVLRNVLHAKSQTRSLEPVSQPAGLRSLGRVHAVVVADVYHDGDLDLVFSDEEGISIWSNLGDGTFTDIGSRSQLPPPDLAATALVPVDWDRDVDLDLVIAGPTGQPAGLLENLRHAQFRWRPFVEEFKALASVNSLAVLDADGDGSWDLAAAGPNGLAMVHTSTTLGGNVTQRSAETLGDEAMHGVETWDLDNDGHRDLLAWTDGRIQVYRGVGGGKFERRAALERAFDGIRTCKTGDLDYDGDLDVAIALVDRIVLLANEGGNRNHWVRIGLRAVETQDDQQNRSFRVNFNGVGSLVEVRAGPRYQAQVASAQSTHFGLGAYEAADIARVVWTNGVPKNTVLPILQLDRLICEEQSLKGSCPYLYTWTGHGFEFFTDCLWAAPLGLQFAEGVFAPSRAWEYLLIPSESLQEHDGRYRMQITEELWEAAYFDEVRLLAVDHPASVDVFSNEKVGPAEVATPKIHTVRQRRGFAAARDHRGRDVSQELRRRDGRYLKPFEDRLRQGLTEEHFIELDLGSLEGTPRVTLFLTGWVYPTDTSLNIAIDEDPRLDAPRPPSLWVPDREGHWQEVRPYIGFPGGKTKTIAINLSDAFLCDDYRVRIATSMELYWDDAFFTVDEEPAPTKVTPLTLVSADLHYRGFSRRVPDAGNGPEKFLYDEVTTEPKWPPMEGNFTRYGDVRELVAQTDDLLVIMGAGDEMTLTFAVPSEPPPPGWHRDFLLYNVGWDKDADLNTVYGQTVEPLPFGAMSGYPYRGDEAYPDTPRHRDYLRTYQTRSQSRARFWKFLKPE